MKPLSGIGILGWAQICPQKKVTNQELAKKLSLDLKSIEAQTGIRERYFLGPNQTAEDLVIEAARKAVAKAGIPVQEISQIICGITSGNYRFPAAACRIQHALKANQAFAFDIASSSTSFQAGLDLAAAHLKTHPDARYVLVAAVAVQSPFINWKDPRLAVILGDGAAAVVVGRVREGEGILGSYFLTDGSLADAAFLRGKRLPLSPKDGPFIEMDGVRMGREFLKTQPAIILKSLKQVGWTVDQLDWLIFHQANGRLIELLMRKLKAPMTKTILTLTHRGNTAEASVPTTLCEALDQGKILPGQRVLLSSAGAGCSLAV
ncbi:MAG: ketoacyl-ACP synthase III, partial [Candidatus Omnitrophica bacterium]|nr:ketoacyl-ACP synthase III [Candidatus Omnitrophota bacterium]